MKEAVEGGGHATSVSKKDTLQGSARMTQGRDLHTRGKGEKMGGR